MKTTTTETDARIGDRIRKRRKLLGFSPQHFASLLGISYQQLSKYETGVNRVGAAQLAVIAKLLAIEVGYFYSNEHAFLPHGHNLKADSFQASQILNEPETNTLIKNYVAIRDYRTRMALVELVSSITKMIAKKAGTNEQQNG